MSALAARRAAALAAATSSSSSVTHSSGIKATAPVPQELVSEDGQSEIVSEPSDEEMEEEQPVAGPSKRRRPAKDHSPRAKQRYFVAESESEGDEAVLPQAKKTPARTTARQTPASKRRKQRARFSPSAPAEITGSEDEADGSGAGGSSDEDGVNGIVPPSRLDWTNPSTPRARSPPAAIAPRRTARSTQSAFVPRVGANVFEFPEEKMAGLDGVPGSGNAALICLKPHEALMIAGVLTVVPLRGALSVFSNTVYPTEPAVACPVFAPTSHPLPVLSPAQLPKGAQIIVTTAWDSIRGSSKAIGRLADQQDVTLFLLREHRTGIEGMRAGAMPGFTNVWLDERISWGMQGVHPVVGSFANPVYPHQTPEAWSAALSQLLRTSSAPDETDDSVNEWPGEGADGDSPVVALVKGPKRSGKSTIARAALNTLLQGYARVAWLDTDLGQGEFAPGGVVGLWILEEPVFGPAFTHPRLAAQAHFLGAYSPLSCPDEYIAAIQDLLQHYRFEVQYPLDADVDDDDDTATPSSRRRTDVVPLVINTQGWVKGLGEELLSAIEGMADPTHIFAFDAPVFASGDAEAFDAVVRAWERSPPPQIAPLPGSSARLTVLPPAPPSALQTRYNAADFRALALLAYLYGLPSSGPEQQHWNFSRPLVSVPPVVATLGEEIKSVYLVGEGAEGVVSDDLHLALNGSVVALLARHDGDDDDLPAGQSSSGVYVQGRPAPAFEDTTFVGYALVRAVRTLASSRLQLQLITPLSPDELNRVSAIVKNGAIELPTAGLLDWRSAPDGSRSRDEGLVNGGESAERPFFDMWHGGVGAGKRRIRRNIQRR